MIENGFVSNRRKPTNAFSAETERWCVAIRSGMFNAAVTGVFRLP